MTTAFVDTNIFIRFFVNDHPNHFAQACSLFKQVRDGQIRLIAPHTVIDEVVFVLSSSHIYKRSRQEIAACLTPLLKLRGMQVYQREAILKALTLYANTKLDFSDCVTIALAKQSHVKNVYSFDIDFSNVEGITRLEPHTEN